MRNWIIFVIVCLFLLISILLLKGEQLRGGSHKMNISMFSWSENEVLHNRSQLLDDLVNYDFNRIFQTFSSKLSDEQIISFVMEMKEKNIDVYELTGTPEWALDETGASMIERLERIQNVNQKLPENSIISGLVVDIEPYLLEKFEWGDTSIKKSYISAMQNVYEATKKAGLELIIVAPYFYDTKGYDDVITTFISESSNMVAIMNYYRGHEIEHIKFEANMAKKYNKSLMMIYEFKQPGSHGLTEKNTYFYEGYMKALENANKVKEYYKEQEIHIGIHDYRAFKEVIENE